MPTQTRTTFVGDVAKPSPLSEPDSLTAELFGRLVTQRMGIRLAPWQLNILIRATRGPVNWPVRMPR